MRTLLTLSATFAALLVTLVVQVSHAQPSILKEGPYSIMIQNVSDNDFLLMVNRRHPTYSEVMSYNGSCKSTIQADLAMPNPAANKAFEESGNYDDLNAKEITGIFTRELSKRCPNATTVEAVLLRMDKPVVASLSKASGWENTLDKLSAEAAANPADKVLAEAIQKHRNSVMFSFYDPFVRIIIKETVECSKESKIYIRSSDTLVKEPKSISTLRSFARKAAPEFKKQCPDVEQIRFRPIPTPKEFECNGDCYLLARLSGEDWTVERVGYEYPTYREEKIQDHNDMIALIKAGDYADIRVSYTGYYKDFHNQFLVIHSYMCTSHINDPVPIVVKSFTEVYDGNGFKVDSYENDKPHTFFLDRKYADAYLRYRNANTLQGLSKLLQAEADNRSDPYAQGGDALIAAAREAGANAERTRKFIAQGCKHPDVLSVYNRLGEVLP